MTDGAWSRDKASSRSIGGALGQLEASGVEDEIGRRRESGNDVSQAGRDPFLLAATNPGLGDRDQYR
jgi:hypothetical protein